MNLSTEMINSSSAEMTLDSKQENQQRDLTKLVDIDMDSSHKDPAYFDYYSQFIHQQNMLQDSVRTSAYQQAIVGQPLLFENKTVLDLGAGSGILSYFCAMANASLVYACEASSMSQKWLKDKIKVIHSKIETPNLEIPRVDVLVSEPIGVLIVHERMMESFLFARDHYLKPNGTMIPNAASIHLAPFADNTAWSTANANVRFWEQPNFYGVDLSPLAEDARNEIFAQPIVGYFDSRILLSPPSSHKFDFTTVTIAQLQSFVIPIAWTVPYTTIIHGIAGWFDIDLHGVPLSTSPASPQTHWQQVRFLLKEPLAVNAYETVFGWFKMSINRHRSYHVTCELNVEDPVKLMTDGISSPVNELPNARYLKENYRKRTNSWNLHEQTYSYDQSSFHIDMTKPETNNTYYPFPNDYNG